MQNNTPMVSIITVVYNAAETIARTIESVKEQTYSNIEYIVVDGGSTDGTGQIVKSYGTQVSCYICEPDEGIYDAMNKGIRNAKGDIIGIINSDDWYHRETVEKVVKYFNHNIVDVVYGNIRKYTKQGKFEEYSTPALETLWYQMAIPHPTVFIKKSIYDQYGDFDKRYRLSADYELMLRLYSANVRFGYLEEVLAYFSDGGLSQTNIAVGKRESYRISMEYLDKSPNRAIYSARIKEEFGYYLLDETVSKYPQRFKDMLEHYFGKMVQEVILFGAGNWGQRLYCVLQKSEVNVKFFVDNYVRNKIMPDGKEIRCPLDLKELDDYIIVAVRNDAIKIKEQLEKQQIKHVVTIDELVQEYMIPQMNE